MMWHHFLEVLTGQVSSTWVIATAGLIATGIALFLARWIARSMEKDPPQGVNPFVDDGLLDTPLNRERRANPRRGGNPVEVDLVDPKGRAIPSLASIVDRSTGGLCLLVSSPMPMGGQIQVSTRPSQSGCRMSVMVEIRGCTRSDEGWIVNCRFARQLSYNELVLFG